MSSLLSLQTHFRATIVRNVTDPLATLVDGAGIDPVARLGIYRNHFLHSLSDALNATFATVRGAVGSDFSGQLAREFVRTRPPVAPCLFEYGAEFADFLAHHPQCRSLPYLPDVARLDWAINESYHAADARALDAARLLVLDADAAGSVLWPHPATRTLRAEYPVHEIWRLIHAGEDDAPTVNYDRGGVCLVVYRAGLDVLWRALEAHEFNLLETLIGGADLGSACGALMEAEAGNVRAAAALSTLLSLPLFSDFVLP
ncbi:MAG: putative DNA-binding domain-containing protein [Alphaproteobacteria bacterium]